MGPVRGGIFANSQSTQTSAGSAYYGVMEISGNLKERVVTIGNNQGLFFAGVHGDGVLTTTAGFEGNADVESWPGMDSIIARGITGAVGSGFRGGSFLDSSQRLRISDRYESALMSSAAQNTFGGRGARTYDGI